MGGTHILLGNACCNLTLDLLYDQEWYILYVSIHKSLRSKSCNPGCVTFYWKNHLNPSKDCEIISNISDMILDFVLISANSICYISWWKQSVLCVYFYSLLVEICNASIHNNSYMCRLYICMLQ
jgi:hypothetical protein